jgi:hypothetical protein
MDLLNDDESPLIKDGCPPLIGLDINMVFTLLVEFKSVEEEVAQMHLAPMEVVFKKPEELSPHLKPCSIEATSTEGQSLGFSSMTALPSS